MKTALTWIALGMTAAGCAVDADDTAETAAAATAACIAYPYSRSPAPGYPRAAVPTCEAGLVAETDELDPNARGERGDAADQVAAAVILPCARPLKAGVTVGTRVLNAEEKAALCYVGERLVFRMLGNSTDDKLNAAATAAWWAWSEGVYRLEVGAGDPRWHSLCGTTQLVEDQAALRSCPDATLWQVGLGANQVDKASGHDLNYLRSLTKALFPQLSGATCTDVVKNVLQNTAKEANLSPFSADPRIKGLGLEIVGLGDVRTQTADAKRVRQAKSWLLRNTTVALQAVVPFAFLDFNARSAANPALCLQRNDVREILACYNGGPTGKCF